MRIRAAGPEDAPALHRLIRALAEYEREMGKAAPEPRASAAGE